MKKILCPECKAEHEYVEFAPKTCFRCEMPFDVSGAGAKSPKKSKQWWNVKRPQGKTDLVEAHTVEIDCGCLVILNEKGATTLIYAPGQWLMFGAVDKDGRWISRPNDRRARRP